jgi:hypothetical protein
MSKALKCLQSNISTWEGDCHRRCSDCATSWTVRGSNLDRGERFFSSPELQDRLWSPHSFLLSGYRCSFSRLKWLGREAD